MRILFINPNTSQEFTDKIGHIAQKYAAPGTVVTAKSPDSGPGSIESIYEEMLSAAGSLELFLTELDHHDAFVLACYSDHPVIYAAREITTKPVLGIAEASMVMACMLGYRFSVVTTSDAWKPLLWDAVRHYGLTDRCASIRTTGIPVLELEEKTEAELCHLLEGIARQAMVEDDAEVICLGCAGMAGVDKMLEQVLGIPVLDGVVCALKLLEGMVGYGLQTSKRKAYAHPDPKPLRNLPPLFSKPYRNSSP